MNPAVWTPEEVQSTARAIRHHYYRWRNSWRERRGQRQIDDEKLVNPRWDGGVDRFGRTYRNIWEQIAKQVVLPGNMSAAAYVEAQFNSDLPEPYPNQLLGHAARARYEIYQAREPAGAHLGISLQCQRVLAQIHVTQLLQHGWSVHAAVRDCLLDPAEDLTALFRFCFALAEGHLDLAVMYQPGAVQEYQRFPQDYAAQWGAHLPEGWPTRRVRISNEQESVT